MTLPILKEIPKSGAQASLAFTIVFSFLGIIVLWTFHPPPGDPAQIGGMINTLIGILAAAATAIVAFYFGSSEGSKGKDATISDIAKGQTGTGNGAPSTVIIPPPSTVVMQAGDDIEGDPNPRPLT